MNSDVNGWELIAYYLKARGKRQGELAAMLGITASAVSQMKHGRIVMNPEQIEAAVAWLALSEAEEAHWYQVICRARLLTPPPQRHPPQAPEAEILPLSALDEYAPAVESISDYLLRTGRGNCRPGALTLEVDGAYRGQREFAGVQRLRIDSEGYPRDGEVVLAALLDGRYLLRKYLPQSDRVIFRSMHPERPDCECGATLIRWMKRLLP